MTPLECVAAGSRYCSALARAAIAFTSWRHRVDMARLGTVSAQWLAEQWANDRRQSEK